MQATKAYVGTKVQLHTSLTQAVGECVSVSFNGRFTGGESVPVPTEQGVVLTFWQREKFLTLRQVVVRRRAFPSYS